MERDPLKIGTRGSRLALWQAEWVRSQLARPGVIVVIKTSGDQLKDVPLQGQSTMGFFTREIEKALLEGEVDLAVHSLKDLPVEQPSGLVLGAILERHDACDVLLVRPDAMDDASALPVKPGARVGAGSLRRRHTLESLRPDLEPVLVRGNVPTRVRKTIEGQVDAMVIARAGLARLGLDVSPLRAFDLDPERWIPAPGQAAVAVEIRCGDDDARAAVSELDHVGTRGCVELERRLLALSGGGCHAPFAAWARWQDGGEALDVRVGARSADGAWRTALFAGDPAGVMVDARSWFEAGCPSSGSLEGKEEICRPARPWC